MSGLGHCCPRVVPAPPAPPIRKDPDFAPFAHPAARDLWHPSWHPSCTSAPHRLSSFRLAAQGPDTLLGARGGQSNLVSHLAIFAARPGPLLASRGSFLGLLPFCFRAAKVAPVATCMRSLKALLLPLAGLIASVAGVACATVSADLAHAEEAYEAARYEDALVWLDAVERDVPNLVRANRARYHYLRGMTFHRLGRAADAHHELALAREVVGQTHVLPEEWERHLGRVLAQLETGQVPAAGQRE